MPNEASSMEGWSQQADKWRDSLAWLSEENVILKNRLSGILRSRQNSDHLFLEQIEYFQNRFLEEDKVISFLYLELGEFRSLIKEMADLADTLWPNIIEKQQKIAKELERTLSEMNNLKIEFILYLTKQG